MDVNTRLVLKAAGSIVAAAPAGRAPDDGLDVYLHIHDSNRATFLHQAQHIYGAGLVASPTLRVDVIPILNPVRLSSASGGGGATTSDADLESLYLQAQESPDACGQDPVRPWDKAAMETQHSAGGFNPLYRFAAVGGTFDHLHSGHKLLLTTAALYSTDKLRCGVTGDALLTKKKFAEMLQPIEQRKKGAESFLRKIRPDLELDIDTITDISGGTDSIPDVEALTVSPETDKSLPIINELRFKNGGLTPLKGIPIPFVTTPDGHVISSTEIRQEYDKQNKC